MKKTINKNIEYKGNYILKDKERYILSNGASGTARIFLEVDYHKRKLTITTPFYKENMIDCKEEFVFKDTSPRSAKIIGSLIADAGRVAEELLKNDQQYKMVTQTMVLSQTMNLQNV